MSDLNPGEMFDGLDDPTPPTFGSDLLPGVMQRGHHLRQQRRMAYAVGSACAIVLVAGAAVGVAASGDDSGKRIAPAVTSTPTPHHTKKPHKHHTESPGTTVGGTQGGGHGKGGHHPPKACVTPTPAVTDVAPSETPTPGDSFSPTPWWTDTPTPDSDATASPTPTPTDTSCASPAPTATDVPTATTSPSPTYSFPSLLSDVAHPWDPITFGTW